MSTGDQSQYIRSKLAERGSQRGAKFMVDGFDRWAESEIPARMGQMEKEPAETQMANYGGAMTLKRAKNLHLSLQGGSVFDDIKKLVEQAVREAKNLREFWQKASKFIDEFKVELRDEIIGNPAYQSNTSLIKFATTLITILDNLKAYQSILDTFALGMQAVGLGRRGGKQQLLGGAISLQDAGKYAKNIVDWYLWIKNNVNNMRTVLALPSLQPVGKQVLEAMNPILGAVGMGRRRGQYSLMDSQMLGGQKCMCPERRRCRVGRAAPTMRDVGEVSEGVARPMSKELADMIRRDEMELAERDADRSARVQQGQSIGFSPHTSPYMQAPMEEAAQIRGLGRKVGGAYKKSPPSIVMPMGSGGRSCGGRAPSARGAIVKKVMAEQGLSLPQASKYVKENGLY